LLISSLFFSVYSLIPENFHLIFSFFSLIVFIVLYPLTFQGLQLLSNLAQYLFLSDHPNNFLAINLPDNYLFLNVSSLFYFPIFSMSLLYSFLNSSIASFVLSRFSFPFHIFDSAMNSFYCTKYLFFPLVYCLFNNLLTFHSSSSLIITRASYSFLCSSTCPIYLYMSQLGDIL